MENSSSVGSRPSLFDTKDDFIVRAAPLSMAAIYFGSFSLAPQDAALARQALFKLSFLHRHFLQPAGLRITVLHHTAILAGEVTSPVIAAMGDLLAQQIDGIVQVKDETEIPKVSASDRETARESIQLLFATDQTLHSAMQVNLHKGVIRLEGEVKSAIQKSWAEQLASAVTGDIDSQITISSSDSPNFNAPAKPVDMDDESLQALVLLRLRLVRETEHLPVKVTAASGILSLQGKVRSEAVRQRAEKISRSTLGLGELRSALTLVP